MSEPDPLLKEKLVLADDWFSNLPVPLSGPEIRRLGVLRTKKRFRTRAVAGCVAVLAISFSLFEFGQGMFQPADQETLAVVSAAHGGVKNHNPNALARDLADSDASLAHASGYDSLEQLQREYDLIEAERVWLRVEQRIEYQVLFPDSVADISVSNYSANKYLTAIQQSSAVEEIRQQKLRQLVLYFPGTIAAESVLAQLN